MQFGNPLNAAGGLNTLANGPITQAAGTGPAFPVPLTSAVRTIIISFTPGGNVPTFVEVLGAQSGYSYFFNPPYLTQFGRYLIVVPIISVFDTSVNLFFTGPAASYNVAVYGDSFQYDESVFYNGVSNGNAAVATNAAATISTGPCRLLTAFVEGGSGTAGSAQLVLNGKTIARVDIAAGGPAQTVPISFPPNTILSAGQLLVLNATLLTGVAGATIAYP